MEIFSYLPLVIKNCVFRQSKQESSSERKNRAGRNEYLDNQIGLTSNFPYSKLLPHVPSGRHAQWRLGRKKDEFDLGLRYSIFFLPRRWLINRLDCLDFADPIHEACPFRPRMWYLLMQGRAQRNTDRYAATTSEIVLLDNTLMQRSATVPT